MSFRILLGLPGKLQRPRGYLLYYVQSFGINYTSLHAPLCLLVSLGQHSDNTNTMDASLPSICDQIKAMEKTKKYYIPFMISVWKVCITGDASLILFCRRGDSKPKNCPFSRQLTSKPPCSKYYQSLSTSSTSTLRPMGTAGLYPRSFVGAKRAAQNVSSLKMHVNKRRPRASKGERSSNQQKPIVCSKLALMVSFPYQSTSFARRGDQQRSYRISTPFTHEVRVSYNNPVSRNSYRRGRNHLCAASSWYPQT